MITKPKLGMHEYTKGAWKNFLVNNLGGTQHPVIVNGIEIDEMSKDDFFTEDKIFIYYEFCKPGKHMFTVNSNDRFYLQKSIIRNREEPVKDLNKSKLKVVSKIDTDIVFDFPDLGDGYACFESDQRLWRIQNFIKSRPDEVELMSYL